MHGGHPDQGDLPVLYPQMGTINTGLQQITRLVRGAG